MVVTKNTQQDLKARERQIQMELFRATSSCVTSDTVIIPEWRTNSTNGFVDFRIIGPTISWFWEQLVNGDDAAAEHQDRFEPGGKYYAYLTPSTRFVLIDFRQNRRIRKMKRGFVYISFSNDYSEATILGLPHGTEHINLEK
jgi:hypothetical protein